MPVASRELDVCGDHTTVKGLCLALYARAFVGTRRSTFTDHIEALRRRGRARL